MKTTRESARAFLVTDRFATRHIGPSPDETQAMLATLGYSSLDAFIDAVVPADIRLSRPLNLAPGRSEREVLQALRGFAAQNQLFRSYIGMGYYPCFTPQVIQRNIVENPGWYTAYTPYQPEIAQGRLEALLNYQTVIADLTGLPIANASLLDEATAAAEAVHLTQSVTTVPVGATPVYLVAENCHPQTIAVLQTRAGARGLKVQVADPARFRFTPGVIGALVQYPTTDGAIAEYAGVCAAAHAAGALVTAATDLLALTLLQPPGEWGADIAIGSSQRFGVPMGYGGPHAAFFATRDEYKRHLPGRIIGVSQDAAGRPALRMALQTREQHIRREKATSNVCTAQVLLAVMASMYAVYHGPEGLRRIAQRGAAVQCRGSRRQSGHRDTGGAAAHVPVPHAPRVSQVPVRDGNAALHQEARGARPLAHLRHDPARLVHDEAQRDDRDGAPLLARVQPAPPLRPARAGAGLPHPVPPAGAATGGDHGVPRRVAAAQFRSPRRAHRPAGRARLPHLPRRRAPRRVPHTHVGPRHQSGQRRHGGLPGGPRAGGRAGQHRPPGPEGAGGGAPGPARRHHDHLSVHARGVRDVDSRYLPHRARAGRPGVHGRGEHERAGGPVPTCRLRRRPLPPEPAQDVLHPPRRRRPGDGPGVRGRAPRPVPPRPPRGAPRAHEPLRHRVGGAMGQRVDPADLLGLRRPHGPRGAGRGNEARDPQRQLHRQAPLTSLQRAVHRAQRARRARVHHRHAPLQAVGGHRGGRHRQADHRLWLPSPDGVFPRAGHADDRADRERIEGGAGPLL